MKVMTINCVYQIGSTGKIIEVIAERLSDRCEFYFCYEKGCKPAADHCYRIAYKWEYLFYHILSRLSGLQYSTGYITTWRLCRYIRKVNPDIVHLHCPNSNTVNIPKLLSFLKKEKIPVAVTNHAEFYYTGNCAYAFDCLKFKMGCGNCRYVFDAHHPYLFDRTSYEWKRMKDALSDNPDLVMAAVSPWVLERMMLSPISKKLKKTVIKNGIDTKHAFYPRQDTTKLRKKYNIDSRKKAVFHVTSVFYDNEDSIKGGRYVIELAEKMPDLIFIVAGPYFLNSKKTYPSNLIFTGNILNMDVLAEYYSLCDLTLVTSKKETYGMVCAESLSCGTPVAGFKSGGMESIALMDYCEFVEYGDIEQLEKVILKWICRKESLIPDIWKDAAAEYSAEKMAEEYYLLYKTLCKKGK